MIGGPDVVRRRRLPEDAARGDAAGRHGRARPPEAARRRARRRHRPVGFDGRLPLQLVQRRHGRRRRGIGGVRKVDIGKEAILRAAAALTERDELGVVAFNEQAHWVVKTQPLGGVDDLQGKIAGIQPNGQTNIFAGLEQAVESLEGATATRRHIILLTDGWSSSGQYDAILAADEGGRDHALDGRRRRRLEPVPRRGSRQQGGGRFYDAANPASIPDIFLKETQQVSGQQIIEEPFFPILTSSSPILRGLDEGLPRLRGYNGTTAKPAAQTVLVTARDDPLLAQWQYGLGRSVAWTSDSTGRWARDWLGWTGFSRFFSQLVSWTFPGEETGGIEAAFDSRRRADHAARRERRSRTARRATSTRRRRSSSGRTSSSTEVHARPDRPGRLRGAARRDRPGRLRRPGHPDPTGIDAARADGRPGGPDRGRVPPPRDERAVPGALRSATGGSEIVTPPDPWIHDLQDDGPLDRPVAAAAASSRCCCGRSTSPCGACRSDGASSRRPAHGSAGPAGRRRATAARTATGEGLLAARAPRGVARDKSGPAATGRHGTRAGCARPQPTVPPAPPTPAAQASSAQAVAATDGDRRRRHLPTRRFRRHRRATR